MSQLNSTAACILGILEMGPPPPDRGGWRPEAGLTGAELWSTLERSVAGFWSMTRSQAYQELRRLEAARLVERADDGRYAITAAGRDAARQWFNDFALAEPRDEQIRSPVGLSVFFGRYLSPAMLARVVGEHRLRYQRRLDQLRMIEHAIPGDRSLPGSTLRRAVLYFEGAIAWADEVLARLETGAG